MHCDCRQQLELSLGKLASEGAGILLYLTQEGRGIGLSNKIRTYRLQNLYKLDTVEANEALGFENDHRIFSGAAQVLNFMGIRSVRLLTNNPLKSKQLEEFGILVDSFCPLIAERNAKNTHYLSTKAKKSNHSL
jgi:GTP cyclohydrolase II